jgi:hypothetical protein
MANLKDFLTELATDPKKLGEFIHNPEAAMATEGLSNEDQAALRSGFPGIIYARLAGVPIEQAFQLTSHSSIGVSPNVVSSQTPLNYQIHINFFPFLGMPPGS